MDIIINERSSQEEDANVSLYDQHHFYLHALACFDSVPEGIPMARFLADQHQLEGEWMIVSPVHWEATHNDAMIVACGKALELNDEEGHQWFEGLKKFTEEDGWTWYYHDAYTWLVQSATHPLPSGKPVYHMIHYSLMPAIQALDKHGYWQKIFTELQMFCSATSIFKKESNPVNGVWFWGMGQFAPHAMKRVITDDAQLYQWCQMKGQAALYFSDTVHFHKDDILAINQASSLDLPNVKRAIKHNNTRWFWLDEHYEQHKTSWWRNLLG